MSYVPEYCYMRLVTYDKIWFAYDKFCNVTCLVPYCPFGFLPFPVGFPGFFLACSAEGMIFGGADLLGLPLLLLGGTGPFAIFASLACLSFLALAKTARPLCKTKWLDRGPLVPNTFLHSLQVTMDNSWV